MLGMHADQDFFPHTEVLGTTSGSMVLGLHKGNVSGENHNFMKTRTNHDKKIV